MSDKPKNVLDLSGLDLEGKPAEPIRVPMKGSSGFITFPNPFEQDAEEVERFLARMNEGITSGQVLPALKEWLPAAEYDKFRKSYPTFRATHTVLNAVMDKFEAAFGDSGEEPASGS